MTLDVEYVRSNFPAFDLPGLATGDQAFFENAGGSFPCRHTVDALTHLYREHKVQPYAAYPMSSKLGDAMDHAHERWAAALGVETNEVSFGPSTSMNTYVLANAFGQILGAGDEIIVTNQDHEANTGAVRRMAERVGATLHEWRIDPVTGLLDPDVFATLLSDRTRLVTFPHASNIVGQENDVARLVSMAHSVGARVIVDGVSFAPHALPDVAALGADVYLFSLYKTYSVHQGLMVTRNGVSDELPNQGHHFNAEYPQKRLTPAGPDHVQVAASAAVLDYVTDLHIHHGGASTDNLRQAAAAVTTLWQDHEQQLVQPVLQWLADSKAVRLLGPGPDANETGGHRCPTVAFVPLGAEPADVAQRLVDNGIMASHGSYYANRVLDGLDVDVARGVVRLSWVHYTSMADIELLLTSLDAAIGSAA